MRAKQNRINRDALLVTREDGVHSWYDLRGSIGEKRKHHDSCREVRCAHEERHVKFRILFRGYTEVSLLTI